MRSVHYVGMSLLGEGIGSAITRRRGEVIPKQILLAAEKTCF